MRLTDEELIAAIEAEEAVALDKEQGELQAGRADALKRYNGDLYGDEVEGRSTIVDRSVMDTIQWILPSLARIFMGGDQLGKFEPIGEDDEYAAECETEVCNWYLNTKSDLYSHVISTLHDALLLKNGYMVAHWTKREDVGTETYEGMAEEEAAMLLQDPDVEVIEHTEYPDPLAPMLPPMPQMMSGMEPPPVPMLHDVKIERKRADEFVAVESVPPDEILVSRRHRWTSLLDADFVQWRRRVSIGRLRDEGFTIPDDAQEYSSLNQESTNRERFEDVLGSNDETQDPTRKVVMFKTTLMQIDLAGTGRSKLWLIHHVDGAEKPTRKEEAAIVNIAAFSPIIYPHSHIGTSVYDLIQELSIIRTLMQRQLIDSVFLQTNGMLGIDILRANSDDALSRGPGRMIRTEGNVNESIAAIVTPDASGSILQALEYLDTVGERRTGVTRYSAGLDADSLNKTATGVKALQSAADQRIELIARTLANGFRDLFLITHALASKHSTKPIQIKLKGKWQPIDPRSWTKRTDFTVSVSLGTGSPESQIMKLQMMAPFQEKAMMMGLAGPEEAYNFGRELWKAAGYKNPTKFLTEPKKDPQTGKAQMPPPQKDPAVQVAEIKAMSDEKKGQADTAAKGQELQMQAAADRERMQGEMAVQASNDQRQAQLDLQKMALEREKMEREYQLKREFQADEMALKRYEVEQNLLLKREEMQIKANLQAEATRQAGELKDKEIKARGNGQRAD